jgi:3-oxoacyl-(acyl-carrier-protein) synthase
MTRRVVVTGIGLVSPFGSDVEGFWRAVRTGQSSAQVVGRGLDRLEIG